jgi:hypothetical protein
MTKNCITSKPQAKTPAPEKPAKKDVKPSKPVKKGK